MELCAREGEGGHKGTLLVSRSALRTAQKIFGSVMSVIQTIPSQTFTPGSRALLCLLSCQLLQTLYFLLCVFAFAKYYAMLRNTYKRRPGFYSFQLATPEALGRLSTNVQRFAFWDRLGN